MFNDRPSNDTHTGGKRVSYSKKPDSFSIGWAVEETNTNRKKDKDVQIKLGGPSQQLVSKPQKQVQRQEQVYRQPPPPPIQKKQPTLNYNQEEVFESLRKYERLQDMPQNELDKVLLYYENMKNEETNPQQNYAYQQPPTQSTSYQQQQYEPRYQQQYYDQPKSSTSSIPIETREPIRPKDNMKGVFGNEPSEPVNTNTRYSQKNKSSLTLGDGYNPFAQQVPKATKKTQFQRIQQNSKKAPVNQGYKISNIFG